MRIHHLHLGLVLAAALLLLRCGEIGPPFLGPLQLEVRHQDTTDGRPLEAVMLHTAVDNYDEADNLLAAPLPRGDATRLADLPWGDWYITVIRKQRPLPDSPRVALTTAEPVSLDSGRYVLLVFDDFFRLLDPVSSDDATS
jgi:hypothetical protein